MALTPPPAVPQRGDRATFSDRVDAFLRWLVTFVSELIGLQANLNSIAAGGAYSLMYTFTSNATNGAVNTGNGAASQSATPILTIWNNLANGKSVLSILQQIDGSSSVIKSQIKLQKLNDPTAYLIFNVIGRTADPGGYQVIQGSVVDSSSANPFAQGDNILVQFQRTGDKGDSGNAASYPVIYLRDQKATGTAPQTLTAGAWNPRNLNTVSYNTIANASLSNNQITLPAGTYWIEASAPCTGLSSGSASHQIRLFNVTDNGLYDIGTNELASSNLSVTRSTLRTILSINATKVYRIEHFVQSGGNVLGGSLIGATGIAAELYTEVKITKVA